jgi:hypothetical protein
LIREENQGRYLTWGTPHLVRQAMLQQLTALAEEAQPASLEHAHHEQARFH